MSGIKGEAVLAGGLALALGTWLLQATSAQAVVYCTGVNYPAGCVARPAPGVGAGAPGVGVRPGVGAGAPGVGTQPANRGGPVNRPGAR